MNMPNRASRPHFMRASRWAGVSESCTEATGWLRPVLIWSPSNWAQTKSGLAASKSMAMAKMDRYVFKKTSSRVEQQRDCFKVVLQGESRSIKLRAEGSLHSSLKVFPNSRTASSESGETEPSSYIRRLKLSGT